MGIAISQKITKETKRGRRRHLRRTITDGAEEEQIGFAEQRQREKGTKRQRDLELIAGCRQTSEQVRNLALACENQLGRQHIKIRWRHAGLPGSFCVLTARILLPMFFAPGRCLQFLEILCLN